MSDTKKEIIVKSLQLFLKNSYKEVTMRNIVDEIGLTKGAIYHHFTSKEEIFEESVKYFYSQVMITDYSKFPATSLKDFYMAYLHQLQNSSDGIDMEEEDANVFTFISEAVRRIPHFLDINNGQKRKELAAWTEASAMAKEKKEITTNLSDEDIAHMFLNLSDGIAFNKVIALKSGADTLIEMKRDWDNLYKLLKNQ